MLKKFFKENWSFFFNEAPPDSFDCAIMSSCLADHGNNLVLVFVPSQGHPKYIMKINKNKEYDFKIENEYNALKYWVTIASLKKIIPYPYATGQYQNSLFFIQSGMSGQSLHNIVKKNGLRSREKKMVSNAIDVLARINACGNPNVTPKKYSEINIEKIFRSQEERVERMGIPIKSILRIIEQFDQYDKGLYFSHGDYWGTNILIDSHTNTVSGIIDWEFSEFRTSLPSDIVWFILNLIYALNLKSNTNGSFSQVVAGSLLKSDSVELITECWGRYMARMTLSGIGFLPLLKHALLELGCRELVIYGKPGTMDQECLSVLKYILDQEVALKKKITGNEF